MAFKKRPRQQCNSQISPLVFFLFALSLFIGVSTNRYYIDHEQKKNDAKFLSQLITQRDKDRNKIYYRVTYQDLIESEHKLKLAKQREQKGAAAA